MMHKMKTHAVLAVATGATVVLVGCSQASGTSVPEANAAATVHATARATGQIGCPQRYDAWRNGPAKKAITEVDAVATSSTGKGIRAQETALKNVAPAVDVAAKYPMPTCADPKGYWNALLLHVNAAAESVKLTHAATSVKLALNGVPQLEHELSTELERTAAAN
jgi:hypothetical protein